MIKLLALIHMAAGMAAFAQVLAFSTRARDQSGTPAG